LSGRADSSRFYIGLDDTDHPDFGCTTATFDDLLNLLTKSVDGFVCLERRLVRLWPFAARRTRGNGALSAIVEVPNNQSEKLRDNCASFFEDLLHSLEYHLDADSEISPVLVISQYNFDVQLYFSAVRGEVQKSDVENEISVENYFSGKSNWGLIGASAAIAWYPNAHSSWELIAWRSEELIGKKRLVPKEVIMQLDKLHSDTFLNRDPTIDKGLISPRTPCPVLYGIRGKSYEAVEKAHFWIQEQAGVERAERYAVHRTNQLSDDHILGFESGTVLVNPKETKGAHSSLKVIKDGQIVSLVAFKEGGNVNKLLRKLQIGDHISWVGLKSPDFSVHLERLKLNKPTPRIKHRPKCCSQITMRSAGEGQPLRCKKCGLKMEKHWVANIQYASEKYDGWVEPSASQRRHLSMPLSHNLPQKL